MSFKITEAVQNGFLTWLAGQLTNGIIRIYKGAVPAGSHLYVDNINDLLCEITEGVGAGGINLGTPSAGVITKDTDEEWYGTVIQSGEATYYRYTTVADTGAEDATAVRVQGGIGELIGELLLADTNLIAGNVQRIDYYAIGMPSE